MSGQNSSVSKIGGGAVEGTAILSTGEAGAVKFLREDGDGTSSWQVPAGAGDVSKVGTPVDSQVGVWTGDGTIEGTAGLTYSGTNLQLTGDIGSTGTRITKGWFTDLQVTNAIAGSVTGNAATVTTNANLTGDVTSVGNATTIANDAVTLAKQANVDTSTVFYRKTAGAGAPEVQTLATLKTDLGLTGTNSGDQTTIVGITGTKAQFDTAVSDGSFMYVGDAPTAHTHEGTAVLSTGEVGGTKFLREDGDGTCSWQTPPSSSGISRTVVVTSVSATMGSTAATDYMYFVAGAHTMSLPAASGNTNLYTIKNNHSANITIDTVGAETIDGAASISIAPEESVGIISNGTNFNII